MVTLDEMKNYLRVDFSDDDELISHLISSAKRLCMDILRSEDEYLLKTEPNAKTAMLYAVAYLYEHRENADHRSLMLTLRALLFGSRQEGF